MSNRNLHKFTVGFAILTIGKYYNMSDMVGAAVAIITIALIDTLADIKNDN